MVTSDAVRIRDAGIGSEWGVATCEASGVL